MGSAVVRRLLRDPDWDVRVGDDRPAPVWMREGCEIAVGDLRDPTRAAAALTGCARVIHLAAIAGGLEQALTVTQVNNALTGAVVQAAVDHQVERFVYVSSGTVFENAIEFPTTEQHIRNCPAPHSPYGFSKLAGEVLTRAAHDQHGLKFTICRPFDPYGPGVGLIHEALNGQAPVQIYGTGEQTRTPTHVDDIADGIVTAMASPAGENADFNISASEELTVKEIARVIWEACGHPPEEFALEHLPTREVDVQRRWPSVEKARRLLGWDAKLGLRDGIAATIDSLRAAPLTAER